MFEITNYQILMYLDGVADPELQKLIENEPTYQTRAQELMNSQNYLSAQLHRVTCPDPLMLGEYHLDLLSHSEKETIIGHLSECPHCSRELDEIAAFVQPSVVERIIAQLISGGEPESQTGWVPLFGQRGAQEGPYVYEAGEIQIAIDVQEDNEHPGRHAIIGLVSGAPVDDFNVSLWFEGVQTATAQIDELNYFKIADLARGEYELLIRGPKVEIQVQRFIV
ncbi:MAG TPA: hypothetical protein VI451_19490 [Anaerolineales bacterium]|nr:hypothetical protein [Anaerolineales bacterium]